MILLSDWRALFPWVRWTVVSLLAALLVGSLVYREVRAGQRLAGDIERGIRFQNVRVTGGK